MDIRDRIKSVINKGGQGIICLTHEDTIIKVAAEARFVKTVNRECEIIVAVGNIDETISPKVLSSGDGWYEMPLYKGDLSKYIEIYSPNNKEILKLMIKAAKKLAVLAKNGIYHRDIKPQNFLVKDDDILIIDFGLGADRTNDDLTKTVTGVVKGYTRAFANIPSLKEYTDIWSEKPWLFDISSFAKTLQFILGDNELLSDIVVKADDINPSKRHQSWEEFIIDLEKVNYE